MKKIQIPFNFIPRWYQEKHVFVPFDKGFKRIVEVWHRRAGKDKTALNVMAREMMKRVGIYYYILPTYSQGRKIIWEGIDASGMKFLDHIPKKLRKHTNKQEMFIEMKNGSIFRVVGSDNVDSVVGTNPVGIVYSEYSLHDPRAWDLFRPVLRENGGWAIFTYTPRGRNHGWRLYTMAKKLMEDGYGEWYATLLGYKDTGCLTDADIEMERMSGMDDDLIDQEYNCSFAVGARGAYYAKQIEKLRQRGRITKVEFDPALPVFTFWDLGRSDSTTIWFAQFAGNVILVPYYYENHTQGLDYYARVLLDVKEEFGIHYAEHWIPHDGAHKSLGKENSIAEQLQDQVDENRVKGVVLVAPRLSIEEGVNRVRRLLPRCLFADMAAARGLDCLENYTKKFDEKSKSFLDTPMHNWASHGADGFRTMAVSGVEELEYTGLPAGIGDSDEDEEYEQTIADGSFNPFNEE